MAKDLAQALVGLREEECLTIIRRRLEGGDDPLVILDDARRGMELVGRRYERKEYFIPELIYSGEIMQQISEIVRPRLSKPTEVKRPYAVALGTVAGDIHDLGLNIVDLMLDMNGFRVRNLGVDVSTDRFVSAISDDGARIVGMSGLLTLAYDSMRSTVEAIEAAGLRSGVKIMVGGSQVDEQVCRYAGADAYGEDAMAAVRLCQTWTGQS